MSRDEAIAFLTTAQAVVLFGQFKDLGTGDLVVVARVGACEGRGPTLEDAAAALSVDLDAYRARVASGGGDL